MHYFKKRYCSGTASSSGSGSIGQACPAHPAPHRHKADQITILTSDKRGRSIAEEYGIAFRIAPLTRRITSPSSILPGRSDFLLNLSVDVSSLDLIDFCGQRNVLYLDTCIEPWAGGYTDQSVTSDQRTNYALREKALALRKKYGAEGPTAVITHGANPGIVSHFTKEALTHIAKDTGTFTALPETREEWAALARMLNVKTIHIAERDTQICHPRKRFGEFVNTWSVDGFVGEGFQPSELGWGSHEKHFPADGKHYDSGCRAAIYLERPGAATRVRSWTPLAGPQVGFLITHSESISIADYLTIGDREKPEYRPTVHYAYHPCDDAVLSLHELEGHDWETQEKKRVVTDEITDGIDELGVLLMGHEKSIYWYGSRLSVEEAHRLAPHNSATALQVTVGVLSGMIWAMKNPETGRHRAGYYPAQGNTAHRQAVSRTYGRRIWGLDATSEPQPAVPGRYRRDRSLAIQEFSHRIKKKPFGR
jgi:homospermidine synthase